MNSLSLSLYVGRAPHGDEERRHPDEEQKTRSQSQPEAGKGGDRGNGDHVHARVLQPFPPAALARALLESLRFATTNIAATSGDADEDQCGVGGKARRSN